MSQETSGASIRAMWNEGDTTGTAFTHVLWEIITRNVSEQIRGEREDWSRNEAYDHQHKFKGEIYDAALAFNKHQAMVIHETREQLIELLTRMPPEPKIITRESGKPETWNINWHLLGGISAYVRKQREWSTKTFGEGRRTLGITVHIAKELEEIRQKPDDLSEWVDVMILALDGYWRHGGQPQDLMEHLQAKQDKNFAREWPKPTSEDEPVEHVR